MVEVRCCCDAHLIGWLPGDADRYEIGRTYLFPLASGTEVLSFLYTTYADYEGHVIDEGRTLHRQAFKSNDYPIEQLRRIAGFREATGK